MGLRVAVVDVRGEPVCDAAVVARDGSFSEELFGFECVFTGALERTGTYTLTARAGARLADVRGVKVTKVECNVRTTEVKVVLPD